MAVALTVLFKSSRYEAVAQQIVSRVGHASHGLVNEVLLKAWKPFPNSKPLLLLEWP